MRSLVFISRSSCVLMVIALGVVSQLAGCAGGGSDSKGRPLVATSAVDAAQVSGGGGGGDPSADLAFFDALESSSLVCHDDVVHTALLLGNGESAPTYAERVRLAERLGYINESFDRPAHEAATIGEVSRVLVAVADGPAAARPLNQDRAVSRLVTRGWLPAHAKAYQGLTGAQLISLVSATRDSMEGQPRAGLRPGAEEAPIARARPEPLPTMATAPTAVEATSPSPSAAAVATREPTPAEEPAKEVVKGETTPAPSPPPEPTFAPPSKAWTPGKTLKRPAKK